MLLVLAGLQLQECNHSFIGLSLPQQGVTIIVDVAFTCIDIDKRALGDVPPWWLEVGSGLCLCIYAAWRASWSETACVRRLLGIGNEAGAWRDCYR